MHLEGLGQDGFETAAGLLASHLVWCMMSDVGDCRLKAAAWFAHFAAYSTRQVSSVGARPRDQVYQDVMLVAFHVRAERQPAESARPADGLVDLHVCQELVTGVRVKRALVTSGQFDAVLFNGVRSQTSPVPAVAAAHSTSESGGAYSRQCATQLVVQGEILRL